MFVSTSTHFLPNFGPHISFLIRLGIVLVYCFQKEIPSYLLLFEAILYIDKQHQILPTCIMNLKINSNLPVYSSLLLYYKKKPWKTFLTLKKMGLDYTIRGSYGVMYTIYLSWMRQMGQNVRFFKRSCQRLLLWKHLHRF